MSEIYFLPLGSFAPSLVSELVAYYQEKFGLIIEVLPAIPFERRAVNYSREQLIGEEVISLMKRKYPDLASDRNVLLIGLTIDDLYIRDFTWRYAFALRQEGRFVVVSSYRMDPTRHGLDPTPELMAYRLKKMISKQIGLLYFRLPQSTDRNSVVFGPIMSLSDLDDMGDDYQETDIPFLEWDR